MSEKGIIRHESGNAPAVASQATLTEQARAVAEVQAAVTVAQQVRRDQGRAEAEMKATCERLSVANKAFYSVPNRGSGPTVHLMRELARIWGNIDYGLNELKRDDEHGQSELQAYAWDLETNSRSTRTFVVQHGRDTKTGRKKLTELRDIAENNNNFGARNVREMIFAVLPQWFTDMAEQVCRETMNNGGGEPLPVRADKAIAAFSRARINREQLEDKVGAPVDEWTHADVTDLEILYGSLARKEITRDEAFPPRRTTVEELTGETPEPPRKTQPKPEPVEHVDTETGEILDEVLDGPMFAQESR